MLVVEGSRWVRGTDGPTDGHEGPAAIQHLDLSVLLLLPDGRVVPALLLLDPHPLAPRRGRLVQLLLILGGGGGRRGRGELRARLGVCCVCGGRGLVFVLARRLLLAAL